MKWLNLRNPGLFESLERREPHCIAVRLNPEHREKLLEVTESEMDGLPLGAYISSRGAEIHMSPHEIGGRAYRLHGESAPWEVMEGDVFEYRGEGALPK